MDKRFVKFSKTDKCKIIDFIIAYNRMSQVKTDTELLKKYPKIKEKLYSILAKTKLVTKNKLELGLLDLTSVENNMFYFTKSETKTLSFLRHLRNAIAHWHLYKHSQREDVIIVKDYARNKSLSCYGKITKENFNKILLIYEK